jgi:NitT/TauT family transport system ATP-binding protein
MKLASGLRPPSAGSVLLEGKPISGPLKIVGMAFQNATLLPWRTALDNVLLPLEIVQPYRSRFRHEREAFRARARSLLETVGLAGQEEKFPWQLSGGMQQRASICRALVHEPQLLLLDEPFGALDAFTREELWCVLRDLWTQKQFTVVLVTHDLREATFLADTVYVMSNRPGRILARKTIDIPRPRDIGVTYTEKFIGIVRELREHIGQIRQS